MFVVILKDMSIALLYSQEEVETVNRMNPVWKSIKIESLPDNLSAEECNFFKKFLKELFEKL